MLTELTSHDNVLPAFGALNTFFSQQLLILFIIIINRPSSQTHPHSLPNRPKQPQ